MQKINAFAVAKNCDEVIDKKRDRLEASGY